MKLLQNRQMKKVVFKISVSFTNFISEISDTQEDNAKDLNVAMPICNLNPIQR